MAGSLTGQALPRTDWPRVQVHPGAGLVGRRGDSLLVVPALTPTQAERVRELVELCSRPDPSGGARLVALRAMLDLRPPAEVPGFALLLRSGHAVRLVVHGPAAVLVDGRAQERASGDRLAEDVFEDGAWHEMSLGMPSGAAGVVDVLPFDLEAGIVPGAGVTLHGVPAGRAEQPPAARVPTSSTALRPAVRFRTVQLGECAVDTPGARPVPRSPLPVAGTRQAVTTGPEVLVEGVLCPREHFTDPDLPSCATCGTALPPEGRRVRLPRPPLGIVVTDGGTIYTVTGDLVIGREAERAPDVLAGRARPLPLRDAARSTSRVHARLTVTGWKVLLSDNGSANGTFVSRHGAAGPWLPVTPHAPLPLVHGDRVRLGQRQLLFDTWRETVVPQVFR